MSSQKAPVSPVIEFIKVFNEMSARYGRSELWYDYIDIQNLEDFDEACEALDSCGVKFELDGGDRIMVEDELRQDALSVFDEYDIDAEEV